MASAGSTDLKRATVRTAAVLNGVDRAGCRTAIKIAPSPIGEGISFNGVIAGPLTARAFKHGTAVGEVGAVEHLLAACHAAAITDLAVECSGHELPLADGSALPYIRLLRRAGIVRTREQVRPLKVRSPFVLFQNGHFSMVVPSTSNRCRLVCPVDLGELGGRCVSVFLGGGWFVRNFASARTFGPSSMAPSVLRRRLRLRFRLRRAGGLVLPARLRFPDEPWRHKVLDLFGDLWLLTRPLLLCLLVSGISHRFNLELVRRLARIAEVADDVRRN